MALIVIFHDALVSTIRDGYHSLSTSVSISSCGVSVNQGLRRGSPVLVTSRLKLMGWVMTHYQMFSPLPQCTLSCASCGELTLVQAIVRSARNRRTTYRTTASRDVLRGTRASRNVSGLLQDEIAPRDDALKILDHLIYHRLVFIGERTVENTTRRWREFQVQISASSDTLSGDSHTPDL